jgi:hypothetical protein
LKEKYSHEGQNQPTRPEEIPFSLFLHNLKLILLRDKLKKIGVVATLCEDEKEVFFMVL